MSGPKGNSHPWPPGVPAEGNVLTLCIEVDSLHAMRAAVAAHAYGSGMTEVQLGRLLLVATELAANIICHGGGTGTLRLWRDGDVIRCQVSDDGPGIADPQLAGMTPVGPDSYGGRGLWLSRQLSDDFTITNRHPGSTVTASMTL